MTERKGHKLVIARTIERVELRINDMGHLEPSDRFQKLDENLDAFLVLIEMKIGNQT